MTRTFVMLDEFLKQWESLELNDEDLARLQNELIHDPKAGSVIQGTGGLRKMRFAFGGRGKSGSVRTVYVDFAAYEKIYLITAYSKSDKDNLTKAERNNIKKMIEAIGTVLKGE